MKLYSGPLSMFGAKVEIALREKSLPFDLEMVAFSQAQGYSPRHPEVLRVNPKRQVPVFLDGDAEIFDSTQIFEYLEHRFPQPPLWPESAAARARARQLELTSDEVFFPHVVRLMNLRATPDPVDSPEWIRAREGLEAYYSNMDALLADRQWLAGDYSYADIAFYMAQFFAARHTVPMGKELGKLLDWRRRMASRVAVQPVIEAMAKYLRSIDYPVPEYA
ncbi:MAG TPA: glutathione S-transferase family protein [Steroidobacteraceae bacterium]|nr:glutathione S-transferase family protein [Steroidobacteraceae bacterium]